jgi:hypothetical protein
MYNIIYDGILFFEEKDLDDKSKKQNKNITRADIIILWLACIVFFVGLLFLTFNKLMPAFFSVIIITIPTVLRGLVLSIKAANSLKPIVFSDTNTKELSIVEKLKFDTFVSGLLIVYLFVPTDDFISFVNIHSNSLIMTEIVLSLYIVLFAFLVSFICLVELIIPFKHFRRMCEFLSSKISKCCGHWSPFFWKTWDGPLFKARLTNKAIVLFSKHGLIAKILLSVLIILAFFVDLLFILVLIIYSSILCTCLVILFEFLKIIGNSLLSFFRMITTISGYRVVKNSFRISGIVAIFVLVICNRMKVLFSPDDTFIAISEFLASTIVLPIIFEWIYSGRKPEISE